MTSDKGQTRTRTDEKRDQLLEFVKELKAKGFKVYAPAKITTYCHFVKDDQIGYLERGEYGFNFSSVHKPCHECGTGYQIHREINRPTVEMAEDCLVLAPHWAWSKDVLATKKYKNWEDYTNLPINNIIPDVEI